MKLKPLLRLPYWAKQTDRRIVEWAIENMEVCPDIEGYYGESVQVWSKELWLTPNLQPPEKIGRNKQYLANRRVCFLCNYRDGLPNLDDLKFVAVVRKDYQYALENVTFSEPFYISRELQPNLWASCMMAIKKYADDFSESAILDNNKRIAGFEDSIKKLNDNTNRILQFIATIKKVTDSLCNQEEA